MYLCNATINAQTQKIKKMSAQGKNFAAVILFPEQRLTTITNMEYYSFALFQLQTINRKEQRKRRKKEMCNQRKKDKFLMAKTAQIECYEKGVNLKLSC